MHPLITYILIGSGGPRADVLAAIWFALGILALLLIPQGYPDPRCPEIRAWNSTRPGSPGLQASFKIRILITAFMLLLVLLMLLSRVAK
jgi:hypothetical protein